MINKPDGFDPVAWVVLLVIFVVALAWFSYRLAAFHGRRAWAALIEHDKREQR